MDGGYSRYYELGNEMGDGVLIEGVMQGQMVFCRKVLYTNHLLCIPRQILCLSLALLQSHPPAVRISWSLICICVNHSILYSN